MRYCRSCRGLPGQRKGRVPMTDRRTSTATQHVPAVADLAALAHDPSDGHWLPGLAGHVRGLEARPAPHVRGQPKEQRRAGRNGRRGPEDLYRMMRALASAGSSPRARRADSDRTALSAELWRVKRLFVAEESYRDPGRPPRRRPCPASWCIRASARHRPSSGICSRAPRPPPLDDWKSRAAVVRLWAAVGRGQTSRGLGRSSMSGAGRAPSSHPSCGPPDAARHPGSTCPDFVRAAPHGWKRRASRRCRIVGATFPHELPFGGDAIRGRVSRGGVAAKLHHPI